MTKNRRRIWILVRGRVMNRDGNSDPVRMIGTLTDIAEKKENERKLKSQNEQLKKVNQELDNFVYRVSHDLRAPITSVLGLVYIINKEHKIEKVKDLLVYVQ